MPGSGTGTDDTPESEQEGGVSWEDIAPEWIITLSAIGVTGAAWLVDLYTNPVETLREFVAVIIVGWVLDAFAWTVGAFSQAYNAVSSSLQAAFFDPLQTVLAVTYEVPLELSTTLEQSLVTVMEPLGIAAPFAMILSWGITATVVAAALWVVYGIAETYLPTESLERPARTLWRVVTSLIPWGGR